MKLLLRLFSSPLSFASRWQEWGHILPDPDTTFPEAALRLNAGVCLSRWFDLFCVYKLFVSIQPFKNPRCFHIVRNQVGLGKAAPKQGPLSIKCKQTHYCGIPPPKKKGSQKKCTSPPQLAVPPTQFVGDFATPHVTHWTDVSIHPDHRLCFSLSHESWLSHVQPMISMFQQLVNSVPFKWFSGSFFPFQGAEEDRWNRSTSSCQGLYWVVLVCWTLTILFSRKQMALFIYIVER